MEDASNDSSSPFLSKKEQNFLNKEVEEREGVGEKAKKKKYPITGENAILRSVASGNGALEK